MNIGTKGLDEVEITDKAREVIEALLKEHHAEGIRVYFMGPG